MATSSDSLYNLLIGQTFTGEYIGLEPKDAGQRAVFKVDKCGNEQLIALFDRIRQSAQGQAVWRGFSDASDSYMGYDWDLWIFAHMSCDIQSFSSQDFVITAVGSFEFQNPGPNGYKVGYNIFVKPNNEFYVTIM